MGRTHSSVHRNPGNAAYGGRGKGRAERQMCGGLSIAFWFSVNGVCPGSSVMPCHRFTHGRTGGERVLPQGCIMGILMCRFSDAGMNEVLTSRHREGLQLCKGISRWFFSGCFWESGFSTSQRHSDAQTDQAVIMAGWHPLLLNTWVVFIVFGLIRCC